MSKILIALLVLAALNGFVIWRLIDRWPRARHHALATWLMAGAFFLLQLVGPFGDHLFFPELKKHLDMGGLITVIDWLSYGGLGILSCVFVYTMAADVIGITWKTVAMPAHPVDFNRRTLLTLGLTTLCTTALGIHQAVAGPEVRKVEIPLDNLPEGFDGFKIAQISDLHAGPIIGREYTENVVKIANSLNADIIVLTGDFVDGSVADLREEVACLAGLEAPLGKFFVTGNHEYYWGAAQWMDEFRMLGLRVLRNEHEVLGRHGQEIVLAGITDYSTRNMPPGEASNPRQAVAGAPADRLKILLAHQPASYRTAHEAGFDLLLSGHTHAGQYFPFSCFIGLFQRYYKGLNKHENMWIYVNSGTGYWGPPLRTGNPTEITLISLRPAGAPEVSSARGAAA
jgi:hypothetical protein